MPPASTETNEPRGRDISPIVHADDYGVSVAQSELILGCSSMLGGNGALNSLSIMANSPVFTQCADLLEATLTEHAPASSAFHIGVHINVVEGRCCANAADIPLLVDASGMFCLSFIQMLRLSYSARHDELQRQLETEVAAQLGTVARRFPQMRGHMRIDGHQHFQLIPALFNAVLAVVAREGYHLDYLRIPAEPILPFLQTPSVLFSIKPINWPKHWILNWLWRRDRKSLEQAGYTYPCTCATFLGILLSGNMDAMRVGRLLPHLRDYAERRDLRTELLFHPGSIAPEDCLNPELTGFVAFYNSEGREHEREALGKLEEALSTPAPVK